MKRISKILSKVCRKNESGLTLIELLVAICITGILITGVSTVVLQVIAVKALSSNMMIATKQVDNAFHYLIRDVQQCNVTALNEFVEANPEWDDIEDIDEPFIEFQWTWEDGSHVTKYMVEGDEIYRNQTIDGVPIGSLRVARFIVIDQLSRSLDLDDEDDNALNVAIVASVGGYQTASETRSIEVVSRLTSF